MGVLLRAVLLRGEGVKSRRDRDGRARVQVGCEAPRRSGS